MVALTDFLIVGAILFSISVAGIFINRKNVILLLMCIELMLLTVNTNFVAFSHFNADISGQVFVFFYFDRCCGRIGYWLGYSGRTISKS